MNYLHVLVVGLLVDTHHEHGGIGGGSRDDDLLRPALVMGPGLLQGGEHPSALHHIHGPDTGPGDGGGVTLREDSDGATINHQLTISSRDLTLVLAVSGVIPVMTMVNTTLISGVKVQCLVKVIALTTEIDNN